MASSRNMRSSARLASPVEPPEDETPPQINHLHLPPKPSSKNWTEPNLRAAVPSYQDLKWQKNHYTQNMKSLGQMPTQKDLEARNKDLVPKAARPRKGKKAARHEDAGTRSATPADPRDSTPRQSGPPNANGRDVDGDYTPTEPPKPTVPPMLSHFPYPFVPPDTDPRGPIRLMGVVESTLRRAEQLKTPQLGKAVEKLWHESFAEPGIADLIDAVLSQNPSREQQAEFQHRIKVAKAQLLSEAGKSSQQASAVTGPASTSSLTSPPKSSRGSVKRRLEATDELSESPGPKITANSHDTAMEPHKQTRQANGTPCKRSSKRRKPSASISSSSSSLSSISSSEHELPSPTERHSSATAPPLPSLSTSDKQHHGPKLHSFPLNGGNRSSSKRPLSLPLRGADEDPEVMDAKRRKLTQNFEITVHDSDIRQSLIVEQQQTAKSPLAKPSLSLRSQSARARNGISGRVLEDDFDVDSSLSPVNGDFLAPPFMDEQLSTRGMTPTRLGRPPKQVRKGARVKMSPQKNKGITAGRARPAGDIEAVIVNGKEREKENEDDCAACGGRGALLCCDSCVRSFHWTCLEPPQDQSQPPPGSWFCRYCIAQEYDQAVRYGHEAVEDPRFVVPETAGLFKPLFKKLHGQTERSFALPKVVKEAFEGVKTGETGEFEEIPLPRSRLRDAHDAVAEVAKLREGIKSTTALCFNCGKSDQDTRDTIGSLGVPREMVDCDYCILNFHLDCLDPPRSTNPKRIVEEIIEWSGKGKRKAKKPDVKRFMCPNHVFSDDPNHEAPQGVSRAVGGKIGKVRRPKHATIKDVTLRRGFRNNGLIEILNDPTDNEKEEDETGVIWRVPERSIKLDFLDRVRQNNSRAQPSLAVRDAKKLHQAAVKQQRQRAAAKAEMEDLHKRTFAEQQVSLALKQLAFGSGSPVHSGISAIDNLIGTLIQEAPQDVAGLFSKEETLTEEQKTFLRSAKEQIERLLARG